MTWSSFSFTAAHKKGRPKMAKKEKPPKDNRTATEKLLLKFLDHGYRPTIPNKPFSETHKIGVTLKGCSPGPDRRELLTKDELSRLRQAVPELSDDGLESVLSCVYNMGDERIKEITWEKLFVFCQDYVKTADRITLTVAITRYNVSKLTLRRAIDSGKITGYRIKPGDNKSGLLVSACEIAKYWPEKR